MQRALDISGLANARDLGGLERRDGTLTPTGAFFRSELLDLVDAAGWETLHGRGVRTVIDLRRPSETSGEVPADIELVRVDLDGDERHFWDPIEQDGRWGTPLYYSAHIRELPHRLDSVLRAIAAAPDGAVLFHCAAGWDRTGLIAAVLLRALDVTVDAATADYLASYENAERLASLHERSFHVEERLSTLSRFGHTPESAFRSMYLELDPHEWFRDDDDTLTALTTWRGAVRPPAR